MKSVNQFFELKITGVVCIPSKKQPFKDGALFNKLAPTSKGYVCMLGTIYSFISILVY